MTIGFYTKSHSLKRILIHTFFFENLDDIVANLCQFCIFCGVFLPSIEGPPDSSWTGRVLLKLARAIVPLWFPPAFIVPSSELNYHPCAAAVAFLNKDP